MKNVQVGQFYWGKFIEGNTPRGDYRILATSGDLTFDQATRFLSKIYFGSHERANLDLLKHGYSFAEVDTDQCVFAHVRPSRVSDRGHKYPVYHGLVISKSELQMLRLQQLLDASGLDEYAPDFSEPTTALPAITVPISGQEKNFIYWNQIQASMKQQANNIRTFFNVLLSNDYSLVVDNIPDDQVTRIEFVQALWDFLPPSKMQLLSFCTQIFDGSSTTFKIKCLYPKGTGRASHDFVLNFATLYLERAPETNNWYSFVVAQQLADNQTDNSKRIQNLEADLKKINNFYPELVHSEQLNLLGAIQLMPQKTDPESTSPQLLMDLLYYYKIINEIDQRRLVINLFERGLQTQDYELWRPILNDELAKRFSKDLLKKIKLSSNKTRLAAGLRHWLFKGELEGRILLSLFSILEQSFVTAVKTDAELLLYILEIFFNDEDQIGLKFILDTINHDSEIEQLFDKIASMIQHPSQLLWVFDLIRSTKISEDLKKPFYLKLIQVAPETTQEIAIELLKRNNGITLTDEEKLYILGLNLPVHYRNRIFIELVSSIFDGQGINRNNSSEVAHLVTIYSTVNL